MDTSSYGAGVLVGGILSFPAYDYVPPGQVVQEEDLGALVNAPTTFTLIGNVVTNVQVTQPTPGS